jgi:hypothetical protein
MNNIKNIFPCILATLIQTILHVPLCMFWATIYPNSSLVAAHLALAWPLIFIASLIFVAPLIFIFSADTS